MVGPFKKLKIQINDLEIENDEMDIEIERLEIENDDLQERLQVAEEMRYVNKDELIDLLYKEIFTDEFDDSISYEKRFKMLNKLSQSPALIAFIRNRYTRVYKSAVFNRNQDSSGYQKGVFSGRVIELLTLLKEIDDIKDMNFKDYLEYQKRLEQKREYFGLSAKGKNNSQLINKTF